MISVDTRESWRRRYIEEVERSIEQYNWLNQQQPVHTRQMTEEEMNEYFGEKRESIHKLKLKESNMIQNERTMMVMINDIDKVKKFVNIANTLPYYVDVVSGRHRIDSKSLMSVFALDLSEPVTLYFHADNDENVREVFAEFEVKE